MSIRAARAHACPRATIARRARPTSRGLRITVSSNRGERSGTTTTTTTTSKYAKVIGGRITAPDVGERTCAVPYWNDEREKSVFVGDYARRAIKASGAEDFVALPCVETSVALRALR